MPHRSFGRLVVRSAARRLSATTVARDSHALARSARWLPNRGESAPLSARVPGRLSAVRLFSPGLRYPLSLLVGSMGCANAPRDAPNKQQRPPDHCIVFEPASASCTAIQDVYTYDNLNKTITREYDECGRIARAQTLADDPDDLYVQVWSYDANTGLVLSVMADTDGDGVGDLTETEWVRDEQGRALESNRSDEEIRWTYLDEDPYWDARSTATKWNKGWQVIEEHATNNPTLPAQHAQVELHELRHAKLSLAWRFTWDPETDTKLHESPGGSMVYEVWDGDHPRARYSGGNADDGYRYLETWSRDRDERLLEYDRVSLDGGGTPDREIWAWQCP